jgi:hypothetical protein
MNGVKAKALGVCLGNMGQKRALKPLRFERIKSTSASKWLWITKVKMYLKRRNEKAA